MKSILTALAVCYSIVLVAQNQTVGLFSNEEEAYNGYTLFSNNEDTYLIDNCGFYVQKWQSETLPGESVYLLENGNLLRTNQIFGTINGGGIGGGFEVLDWDSNVLWAAELVSDSLHAHHDIAPLPNGNFLALVWEKMSGEEAVSLGRLYDKDILMEKVVEIKMVGTDEIEIVWEWNLKDHLIQDTLPEAPNYGVIASNRGKMDFNFLPEEDFVETDWIHINSIDYNPDLDHIALSVRNFHEVWIIDHSTTTAEAATSEGGNSGKGGEILYRYGNPQVYDHGDEEDRIFGSQHNAEWITEGTHQGCMTVFNNFYTPNQSSVDRWTPPWNGQEYILDTGETATDTIQWRYTEPSFLAFFISGAQVLPNDNVLICDGPKGRFFEINESGELLWEYINPINAITGPVSQGMFPFQNNTFKVKRYSPEYTAFDNRILEPIAPIELNPDSSSCTIYTAVNTEDKTLESLFSIVENPVFNYLTIQAKTTSKGTILNNLGRPVLSFDIRYGNQSIDIGHLPSGVYFLQNEKGSAHRFIKI